MKKEFTRKITVGNHKFLYEDNDIMIYSCNIKVREKTIVWFKLKCRKMEKFGEK